MILQAARRVLATSGPSLTPPREMTHECHVPAGDAAILSLFRKWIEERRARAAIADDGDTIDAAINSECEIEHMIPDTPAEGPVGLAIKLYLSLHADHYACTLAAEPASLEGFDPGIYGDNPERYVEAHSIAAALRDAARFVPEIAVLAKAMIGQPPAPEFAQAASGPSEGEWTRPAP